MELSNKVKAGIFAVIVAIFGATSFAKCPWLQKQLGVLQGVAGVDSSVAPVESAQ